MSTLYLECNSGISGDMTVAALLDLGANKEKLESIINNMDLGCSLKFGRTEKNGISAYDFDVILSKEHEHRYDHSHNHSHLHRGINDIIPIIDNSLFPNPVKDKAKEMFMIVAEAESRVHGIPLSEVHFHEVGAIDSIVDICAVAFCLYDLGIDRLLISPLSEGTGEIKCQHGIIPVPVPATLEITRAHNIPLVIKDVIGEMVTPTGATIAAIADGIGMPSNVVIEKVGYGAGKRDYPQANILRAMLLQETVKPCTDEIVVLETNVDDSTPEELGYCLNKLFDVGVKDAFFTPIYMKKARPAYSLTVMCKPDVEENAIKIIFEQTSSVGLRRSVKERVIMEREKTHVETHYGSVSANRFSYGEFSKVSIEYDSAKELAEKNNVSITKIYRNY